MKLLYLELATYTGYFTLPAEPFYKVLDELDYEIFFQSGKSYAMNLKKVLSLQHHFTGQSLALLKSGKWITVNKVDTKRVILSENQSSYPLFHLV